MQTKKRWGLMLALVVVMVWSESTGAFAQGAAHDVITFETGQSPTRQIHVAITGNAKLSTKE